MDNKQREQIIAIIDAADDMTIATIREDGFPQATTVSYVNDGLTIYFGTSEGAQKTKNIDGNNKVSITVNRSYDNWEDIEGISIGATAERITNTGEQEKVSQLMLKKFPQIAQYAEQEEEYGTMVLFRIDPKVISLLDYRKGFGHTELVNLDNAKETV